MFDVLEMVLKRHFQAMKKNMLISHQNVFYSLQDYPSMPAEGLVEWFIQ